MMQDYYNETGQLPNRSFEALNWFEEYFIYLLDLAEQNNVDKKRAINKTDKTGLSIFHLATLFSEPGVGTTTFSRFSWFSRFRIFFNFWFSSFSRFRVFSILHFRFLFYENGKTTKTFSRKRFPFSFWFSFSFCLNFAVFLRKIEAIIS